jgi:hypothetical protein
VYSSNPVTRSEGREDRTRNEPVVSRALAGRPSCVEGTRLLEQVCRRGAVLELDVRAHSSIAASFSFEIDATATAASTIRPPNCLKRRWMRDLAGFWAPRADEMQVLLLGLRADISNP